MAIGDRVQAGLMRVDSSPILLAGQAQAQANQAFGNAVGGVVEKFYQKKKDKQEREQRERAYREAGLNAEEAKAASGDKELGNLFINKLNADRNFNLQMLQFKDNEAYNAARIASLADESIGRFADRERKIQEQERLSKEAEENKLADNQFINKIMGSSSVPTGQLNKAGQDELERGSLFIAPTEEARSDFKATLLKDPSTQTKVPMMDLSGNQLFREFSGDSPEVQRRAFNLMQARQKDAPKPMTPEQLLDYQIKLNKERRDQAKEEREASEFEDENKPLPPADPVYKEAAINAIDSAIEKSKGFFATGVTGQALQGFAGTDARDLAQAISTVEAAVGFDRLQEMRDSSKTGGALGAINTKELELLSNSLGSLDPLQKPETLRKNLESIKEKYVKILKSVEAEKYAFENDITFKTPKEAMDFVDNFNAPSPQQPTPQSRDELLKQEADLQKRLNERLLNNPPVQQFRGI